MAVSPLESLHFFGHLAGGLKGVCVCGLPYPISAEPAPPMLTPALPFHTRPALAAVSQSVASPILRPAPNDGQILYAALGHLVCIMSGYGKSGE
jgi:hypothetical protein